MTDPKPSSAAADTWYVTESLWPTAVGVAAYRAAETAQPNPLIRDDFAARLVDALGVPGWQRLARADTSWLDADDERGRRLLTSSREFVATRTLLFGLDDQIIEIIQPALSNIGCCDGRSQFRHLAKGARQWTPRPWTANSVRCSTRRNKPQR